jgi:hypothetical protein
VQEKSMSQSRTVKIGIKDCPVVPYLGPTSKCTWATVINLGSDATSIIEHIVRTPRIWIIFRHTRTWNKQLLLQKLHHPGPDNWSEELTDMEANFFERNTGLVWSMDHEKEMRRWRLVVNHKACWWDTHITSVISDFIVALKLSC